MEFNHIPIMVPEVLEGLNIKPEGTYVDGTAGGGNHSFAIGSKLSQKGKLICVDRDQEAIKACTEKIKPLICQKEVIHSAFNLIPEILEEKNIKIDGLLVDLGVSSHQLSKAERGFSYMQDGLLDMRMNSEDSISAKDIVNNYSQEALEKIFFEYGEERYSRRIAENIIKKRSVQPINTTFELVDIIKEAMPAKALREKQHPAKRIFQAIRISVNEELFQISSLLENIIPYMNSGGRITVITFHSLEDKIVKAAFNRFEKPCVCPPDFPVCVCGKKPLGHAVGKPKTPSAEEIEQNPKSRSSRLRVFEIV